MSKAGKVAVAAKTALCLIAIEALCRLLVFVDPHGDNATATAAASH